MTPTGKGIVLAALDILVETGALIERDRNEVKSVIEQISENDFSLGEGTEKIQTRPGRQKNAKQT